MRSFLLVVVLTLVAVAGCDLVNTANQLQAQNMMVALVVGTPPVPISAAALAGFDAGSIPADAGFMFDGGVMLDGGVTLPSQTIASLFFGSRPSTTDLSSPPSAITDATVTLAAQGGTSFTLTGDGKGTYTKTSVQDANLKYQAGATYDFTAVEAGQSYVGEVQQAPAIETIPEFHPQPQGYTLWDAGTDFTFTRTSPAPGQTQNLGFVNVFTVDNAGQQSTTPTYTNIPTTPLAFLQLIAAPSAWKTPQVTVPGSAFLVSQQTYVIVFESVKTGGPQSSNLFTGSAVLAGTADVGVVRTR